MPLHPPRLSACLRHLVGLGTLFALLTLAGCATPPPPAITADLPLAQAVGMATDQTVRLLDEQRGLARYLSRSTRVYVAPVVDAGSRQQTVSTVRVRELIAVHLKSQHRGIELVPFTAAAAARSELYATKKPDKDNIEKLIADASAAVRTYTGQTWFTGPGTLTVRSSRKDYVTIGGVTSVTSVVDASTSTTEIALILPGVKLLRRSVTVKVTKGGPQAVRIGIWAYLVVGTRLGGLSVTAA